MTDIRLRRRNTKEALRKNYIKYCLILISILGNEWIPNHLDLALLATMPVNFQLFVMLLGTIKSLIRLEPYFIIFFSYFVLFKFLSLAENYLQYDKQMRSIYGFCIGILTHYLFFYIYFFIWQNIPLYDLTFIYPRHVIGYSITILVIILNFYLLHNEFRTFISLPANQET